MLQEMNQTAKTGTHFRLLSEIGLKLQTLSSNENIYEEIVSLVQSKFHYYSFTIWSVSADGTATLRTQSGAYSKFLPVGYTLPKSEGIIGTVIRTKQPYVCSDVLKDPHFTSLSFEVETKSQLSIPVMLDGKVTAVLTVESNIPNAFDDDDKMTFEALGGQLAVSISNLHMVNEIKSFNKRLQLTVDEKTSELRLAQDRILDQQRLLQKENRAPFIDFQRHSDIKMIAESPAIKSVITMVDKVAPTAATVLIQGESGTGKELIARRLHAQSERLGQPYVTINCGALQETLLESELFGHEKGSFTGAVACKMGLAETADGGTLFLDEIGELSIPIQAKLLRFLQEGEIYRVGGKRPIKVDLRIISATNRDLEKELITGRFREDLFYRLNTITLRMPPLRKRKEDIRALIDYFLKNPKFGGPMNIRKVDVKFYEVMEKYEWPGNIRELQNTIERIKILIDTNEISIDDVPLNIRMSVDGAGVDGQNNANADRYAISLSLEELEKKHITRIVNFHQGNKTKSAQALGITIKTLYNKLSRYQ